MIAVGSGIKYFFIDLVSDLVRWPVWWYSRGLILILRSAKNAIVNYWKVMAVDVWVKNLFVPMYGMRDWQTRIISFFMRLAQIIGRSIAWIVFVVVVAVLVIIYVFLPVAIILGILNEILA